MTMEDLPTYLSIDLDYWTEFPTAFMDKVASLNVPTAIAIEHHRLIHHINSFDCVRLVNVDTHSDLCGGSEPGEPVEDGTWGAFVSWRDHPKSSFVWSYPLAACVLGRTNQTGTWCDNEPELNPFFKRDPKPLCGWSKTSRRISPIVSKMEWHSIKAVGICLSPAFLPDHMVPVFARKLLNLAKKHKFKLVDKAPALSLWRNYETRKLEAWVRT